MEENGFSNRIEVLVAERYSLFYTFMSSFASYLFELRREGATSSEWVGLFDPFRGVVIEQAGDRVFFTFPELVEEGAQRYLLEDVTGLWYRPVANATDERSARIISLLSNKIFPGLRVPRLRLNQWDIFCSVLFSIHAKVSLSRSWFTSLREAIDGDWRQLIGKRAEEVMALTRLRTSQSAGFRARYLLGAIADLYQRYPEPKDPMKEITKGTNLEIRMRLMRLSYVGPKVADCFLLNGVGDLSTPPVDVNVYRVTQNLGILPPYLGLPSVELCLAYACTPEQSQSEGVPLCPKAERTVALLQGNTQSVSGTCVRAALTLKFSDAGWVQALLFLYGQRFCTRYGPSCNSCDLKDFSVLDNISKLVPIKTRLVPIPRPLRVEPFIPDNIPVFDFYPEHKEACLANMKRMNLRVKENRGLYGRGSRRCFAAFLWLATKEYGIPALVEEIAEAYEVNTRDLLGASSSIRFALDLNPPNVQPSSYIQRLQKVLLFSDDIAEKANEVASQFPEFSGKRPESVAAASLYVTLKGGQRDITIRTISESLGIADVTTRNSVKILERVSKLY